MISSHILVTRNKSIPSIDDSWLPYAITTSILNCGHENHERCYLRSAALHSLAPEWLLPRQRALIKSHDQDRLLIQSWNTSKIMFMIGHLIQSYASSSSSRNCSRRIKIMTTNESSYPRLNARCYIHCTQLYFILMQWSWEFMSMVILSRILFSLLLRRLWWENHDQFEITRFFFSS